MKPISSAERPSLEAGWWTPRLSGPVLAAAAVRGALLAAALARNGVSALLLPDTSSYLIPGRNLLLHGRFFADGVPDLLRTPGYPLFLAITSLAGPVAGAAANVLLSVFSVILVWRLGRAVFGDDRIAIGAAWIFAFEPLSIANSVVLLSETLFLALFLLSLERLAAFLRRHSLRMLAASGAWLAAATLVRPVTYYLPVALALGLFLVLARERGLRWKAPAVLLISVLPWLAAWQTRNKLETGYSGLTSVSDLNLYFFVAADVAARVEHRSFTDVRGELGYLCGPDCSEQVYLFPAYFARHPEQTGWTQTRQLAFMHSEAVRVIRTHFGVYLRTWPPHLFEAVFDPGAGSFNSLLDFGSSMNVNNLIVYTDPVRGELALVRAYPWIAAEKAVFVVVLLGLYLLAARGALRGGMPSACLWLLLGTSFYILVISAAAGGAGVTARYRLPVMPIVCIFAAAGALRSNKVAQ
jgi:4-amino-4-deoxy-L-arabinose transferase-like glycosyltransferase